MNIEKLAIPQDAPEIDWATLDLLPYGIIVVDRQGTILYYNSREEQIANRTRAEVLGKNFFTEVAPCTQVNDFYGRFCETTRSRGDVANFHFVFPFPEQPREVEISLTSFDNKGELLCLISVKDMTEQMAVRELILQAERQRELGEVAAGVAHNFNNLLMAIRGNAELLLMKMAADDPGRSRLERIIKASDDGEAMVKRIHESARQQPEQTADVEVDLNDIVRDSLAFTEDYARVVRDERGAVIEWEAQLADDLPPVRALAGEMREVFVNLLRNAVDAIETQGRVIVRTRFDDGMCLAEVSDTGHGIGAELLGKVFRPLFTTKGERGTGMGLATCYAILRRHGGNIEVKSSEGQGTTFTLQLPAAK